MSAWASSIENVIAQAFQLLASAVVSHIFLSRWLEKRLDQSARQNTGTDIA